jgi:hypothetical protein
MTASGAIYPEEAAEIDGSAIARAGRRQEHGSAAVDDDVNDKDDIGNRTGVKERAVSDREDQAPEDLGGRGEHDERDERVEALPRMCVRGRLGPCT